MVFPGRPSCCSGRSIFRGRLFMVPLLLLCIANLMLVQSKLLYRGPALVTGRNALFRSTISGKFTTGSHSCPKTRLPYSRPLSSLKAKPNFQAESDAKYFEFNTFEKSIYDWWEQSGYFKPSSDVNKKSYVIPMPPPNVTGYLHMGHAMFIALQDIMARFHRMRGRSTLWLPGT
jgi:hypothetical protein